MRKERLETFSDSVIAIIITITVLELKVPHGDDLASLKPLFPILISYILSFINIGIYWNNHHHLMQAVRHIDGKVMWANAHLLFWLSLFPFATAWMGENNFTTWPIVIYGGILAMAGIAYYLLSQSLIRIHGKNSTLAVAVGKDQKGIWSVAIYFAGILLSFKNSFIGLASYALVAAIWFLPDRRIEKKIGHENEKEE